MKKEKAKQRLFTELDKSFSKFGADAGMCGCGTEGDGFFPHYAECGSDSMRPTWFTKYEIEENVVIYTMYENIEDLCISILFKNGEDSKSALHTGYPKSIEDAKRLVHEVFEK